MPPRADLAERAASYLPGESPIRQAFICQAAPSFAFFLVTYLTGLTMLWIAYRCVAVTDGAIYVLDCTRRSGGSKPVGLAGVLPRTTPLGPTTGRWAELELLGERHWVHRRFHEQIAEADAAIGETP